MDGGKLMTAIKDVVLIPGHGIGPEIAAATQRVLAELKAPLRFHEFAEPLDAKGKVRPDLIAAIKKTGIALKGPLETPIGGGYESINVQLRRALDLYANVRPAKSFSGIPSPYHDIDIVVVRENLEGLYSGVELPPTVARERIRDPRIASDAAVTCHVTTPRNCRRIAEFAFQYASRNNRRKVTITHKANINKLTDGMFLNIALQVAEQYPDIEHETLIVDNFGQRLVLDSWKHPRRFDVVLFLNHYGDIFSDIVAGMVGGLGVAPSGQYGVNAKYDDAPYINAQLGDDVAVFEAVHGTAPDIAGKGIANPTALLLSAALMLRRLEIPTEAERLEGAIAAVLAKGKKWRTRDLDGDASTEFFTNSVIQELQRSTQ